MNIKQWATDDRPRERMILHGATALSNAELLAILIGSGSTDESAVELMRKILGDYRNSLNELGKLSINELCRYKGIGQAKAVTILAAAELGKRRAQEIEVDRNQIRCSTDIYRIFHPIMCDLSVEECQQQSRNVSTVNVRISAGTDKIAVIHSLQKAMEKFTPGHDFDFRFMDEVIDNSYRNELRFTRQILLFSLLAIVISMIGVFGLTMFESEYRRKEIGIRKIFGSTTGEILRMFNKRYLYILMGCFVVAAPFGWWIGLHWLEGFAEKAPISAWIFLISFLLVTAITLLTVTVQSWRTARENPANSIKTE